MAKSWLEKTMDEIHASAPEGAWGDVPTTLEVELVGFSGNPAALISWEATATGVTVRILPPLSSALRLSML